MYTRRIKREFQKYTMFILDCDGVIWKSNEPIVSAIKALRILEKMGKNFVFLTNNSSLSRDTCSKKLARMGIKVPTTKIFTSSYSTAIYLKNKGIKKVFTIGEEGLLKELRRAGIITTYDSSTQAVVVGIDRDIDYWKIAHACRLLKENNTLFIVTNTDATIPTSYGEIPGAGSIVSCIITCSGRKPNVNIGKPSPLMFRQILKEYNVSSDEVLVIGDRLETDILGAVNAGLDSALVLTGVTRSYTPDSEDNVKPRYVLKSLMELFA